MIILLLAFTGMRFGELVALKIRRVDLLRRRLEVAESASEIGGLLVTSSPKNRKARTVGIRGGWSTTWRSRRLARGRMTICSRRREAARCG